MSKNLRVCSFYEILSWLYKATCFLATSKMMVQEAASDPSKHSAVCVPIHRVRCSHQHFVCSSECQHSKILTAANLCVSTFLPCFFHMHICHWQFLLFPSFLTPFFNSAHGSIRHHGTVWSLSDFSYNGCCDHVSMGIANSLLRRSWRCFQPLSHCYKGTEPQKRPRNLSCSGAWKELLQPWHLMDLSLDYKSRLLPPWLMKSCFKEKMRKQWKLWLLCWGQEGWREPKQKGSSQEPDLMAGKHTGLRQLRRKKFFSPSVF